MTDGPSKGEIPAALLARSRQAKKSTQGAQQGNASPTRRKTKAGNATSARILAAGISVSAGIGLVGYMAADAASQQAAEPVPIQRVLVIQQPSVVQSASPTELPATTTQAQTQPTATILEIQPVAEPQAEVVSTPDPTPTTTSEGS